MAESLDWELSKRASCEQISGGMSVRPKPYRRLRLVATLIFAAAVLGVVAAGYLFYQSEVRRIKQESRDNLSSVCALKADQIGHWRKHLAYTSWRLANGRFLEGALAGVDNPALRADLQEHIRQQTRSDGEVLLFTPEGRLILSAGDDPCPDPEPLSPAAAKVVEEAAQKYDTVVSDLYRGPCGKFVIDAATAVHDAQGKTLAVLVLRADAGAFLFPLVNLWPVASESGETLMVRKEGDKIVYLNAPSHYEGAPMSLVLPASLTSLVSAKAVAGKTGSIEGQDYRGVRVLAEARAVPGSDWFLISKTDESEVFADMPRRLALISIIGGLIIMLAAALIAAFYARRQARVEHSLKLSEDRFRAYIENAPYGIFVTDEHGNFIDLNPAALKMSGYSARELLGRNITDLQYEGDKDLAREMFQRMIAEGHVSGELRHVTKRGEVRTWHINSVMPDKHRTVGFVSDMEEQKQSGQLTQLNARRTEALLTLTEAVETMKEAEFMSSGLELAEDLTGSCISFIHFINDDEKTIELVTWSRRTLEEYCHAAFDRHYPVEKAGIWADALRQRRPVVVNDYATHPVKHGLPEGHSELTRLVSVPVIEDGKVVMLAGVGNKKTEYNEWDIDTVRLIANQIWSLVQRRRGLAALSASEQRLRQLIEASPVPFAINTGDGAINYVNAAFTRAFGYTAADIPTLETWWVKAYPNPAYREHIRKVWQAHAEEALRSSSPIKPIEAYIVCKDGSCRTILASAARLNLDDSGDVVVNLVDVTQLKDAERRVIQLSQSYVALGECNQAVIDSDNEQELFEAICRAIVDHGGMKMAWVGMVDPATKALKQVSAYGEGTDYLRDANISLDPNVPAGRGPSGTAIREGRPVWCHDFAKDAMTAPWRESGAKFGWACSASLPLRRGGRVIGALTVYSGRKDAFGDDVQALFLKVAANISFALDYFARDKARIQAEAALQSSRNMLSKVINASPQSVFWKDRNSIYLGCNENFARSAGLAKPEDIVGKSDFDLPRPPEDVQRYIADDAEVMENNRPKLHFTEELQRADGTRIWIDTSKVPLTDAQGRVYGVLGMHEDITQRKLRQDELLRLRTAVEQSANIIVITNTQGIIEYVNPAFEKVTGYTAAEAVGQNPRLISSGEQSAEFYKDLWNTINAGRSWSGQFHNRRRDGSLFWEAATISPVLDSDGRIRSFIAVKQDITQRKVLEQDLLEAKERAEAASRAKSEFLAVMSHELRTPLNGVLGFAELLADSPLDKEQLEFVRTIRSSGSHLLHVVNDILDFSSIEQRGVKLSVNPLVISDLLESAAIVIKNAAEDKGLEFRTEIAPGTPGLIKGDALRIRQILINLLGNAVKFTSQGSVTLRISLGGEGGRRFVDFAVKDTGTGIPADALGLLFEPFTQADSTHSRRFKGTGLGLAISQRLAQAMEGEITVDSAEGEGSTFTFRLPYVPTDSPVFDEDESEDLLSPPHPGAEFFPGLPVLIVEDDRVSSVLAVKVVSLLGYDVELASNGREAVESFAPGKYTAILMDMQMPKVNGIEATIQIRAMEKEAGAERVPIIALTANVMPGDRERCIEAGMDDFLTKPLNRDELARKLAAIAKPG